MKLIWSARARRQLLAIIDHIAQDAPERALAYGDKIDARAQKLVRFPSMGRVVPEWPEKRLREILIDDYRLVYRVRTSTLEIVTLFHGRRRFPT